MEFIMSLFTKPVDTTHSSVDPKRAEWIDHLCATRGTEYRAFKYYPKFNI